MKIALELIETFGQETSRTRRPRSAHHAGGMGGHRPENCAGDRVDETRGVAGVKTFKHEGHKEAQRKIFVPLQAKNEHSLLRSARFG